jgi:hypothetical protein
MSGCEKRLKLGTNGLNPAVGGTQPIFMHRGSPNQGYDRLVPDQE